MGSGQTRPCSAGERRQSEDWFSQGVSHLSYNHTCTETECILHMECCTYNGKRLILEEVHQDFVIIMLNSSGFVSRSSYTERAKKKREEPHEEIKLLQIFPTNLDWLVLLVLPQVHFIPSNLAI